MSAEIINLNRFRKVREREARQEQAAENRVRFGRTREERERDATTEDLKRRVLDGALREPVEQVEPAEPDARLASPDGDDQLDPGAVS